MFGIKKQPVTHIGKMKALMQRPQGATNYELSHVSLNYTRRISDMRRDGEKIKTVRQYSNGRALNTFKYYITEEK